MTLRYTDDRVIANMKRGILISLEGGEGSGKSTQALHLKNYFKKLGYRVRIVQEPGETYIGKQIRQILLNPKHREMGSITEVLLYMAARSQLVHEMIIPAMKKGEVIICDRYMDSSMAYQGYGRKIGFDIVGKLNQIATQGYIPDITFYFDVKPETGLARKKKSSGGNMDRMEIESLKFHRRIRQGYKKLARLEPNRIKIIPSEKSPELIWDKIKSELDKFCKKRKIR